jgi:Heterokaryon incompatibility protein (HET)
VGDVGETVYLVIANDASASYIALSHCWGGISQSQTTSFTLESHKNGIPLASLSKTVQDAVSVTRRLGIRFLWVDSLCIVQDDEGDWFLEAGRMASVYEWAYCVIAATGSTDGAGGCFRLRQSQDLVQVPCQPQHDASRYMYFGIADENAVRHMFQGPLNARAWVLQEHIFARRTIHFAADQTYWECDKIFIGEDCRDARSDVDVVWLPTRSLLCCILGDFLGPDRMPHLVHDPPQEPFTKRDFFSIWAAIVQFYTRCDLTKPSDKLPALLSLSTELQKLTGDEYHEGHWLTPPFSSYSFASSLLWRAAKERSLQKPSSYRAPSWSWAALDGPVEFVDMAEGIILSFLFQPQNADIQVLKVQVYRPIGLPPGKALLLSASTVRTSIFIGPCVSRTKGPLKCALCMEVGHRNVVNVSDESGKLIEGSFAYDLADNQPIHFWLLLLYVRWAAPGHPQMSAPIYYALLVSEVANQRKAGVVFRRVGVGHVEDARPMYGRTKQFLVLI